MATRPAVQNGAFTLEVPLDASKIENFKPEQPVKALVQDAKGALQSQQIRLDAQGHGIAKFTFAANPGDVRVMVGPHDATDVELTGLQSIVVSVAARQWANQKDLKLTAVPITDFYWRWWLTWCRTFTIHGRVVCPDGRPVPGANVCAYDVDWWWWWFSEDLIGCQTTDANGVFTITFRWCCGWWPWWWWRLRYWQLELSLAERILAVINKDPRLPRFPVPSPKPDLAIFERVGVNPVRGLAGLGSSVDLPPVRRPIPAPIDPGQLAGLRQKILPQLPAGPELAQLRIWPWFDWAPWWDCNPDIVFRATQNCNGVDRVIVNETVFNTRFNIPTSLDVTLVANEACCVVTPPPPPAGNCVLLSSLCGDNNPADQITNIGGNFGAPPLPVGYRNPGKAAADGDRPYAGVVNVFGQFGAGATADYYEFEYSDDNGTSWQSLPPGSVAAPPRLYFGPPLFGEPPLPPIRATPPTVITSGVRTFIESRAHFEAHHGAGSWGTSHFWTSDWMEMVDWITSATTFKDGTYRLRVRNWTAAEVAAADPTGAPDPTDNDLLHICDGDAVNNLYITLDNRIDPDPSHPSDHACGPGTVHICTNEPDTHFIDVRLVQAGQPDIVLEACANKQMRVGDTLQIDFYVHDPDGHLSYYELYTTFGDSEIAPVLALPSKILNPGAPYLSIPSAAQVGPDYGTALAQGATSPIWSGGTFRLTIPAADVFKKTCCYQLVLYGHKRTLACGDESLWLHTNLSEYSFMIQMP